jgi:hypothetical protein
MRKRLIVLSSVACSALRYFYILSHKRHDLKKKKLLNTKCVFGILYKVFLKHFSFWEDLSEIWSKLHVDLHVKYPLFLSDFNESLIFLTDFRKIPKYEISWKSFSGPKLSMQTNRRTDWHDEANSRFFCNFANSAKNSVNVKLNRRVVLQKHAAYGHLWSLNLAGRGLHFSI